jgi:arsenate reductase
MKVYHNPRCSKSRCALDWLQENNFDFEVVDYMKNRLNESELKSILIALKMQPLDLIRMKESEFKEHIEGRNLKADEIIQIMVNFPKLIERPIVIWDSHAVVARPLEKLTEMLNV